MANDALLQAVGAAIEAEELGYRIVAWELNKILTRIDSDLSIPAEPPVEGKSIKDFARLLGTALPTIFVHRRETCDVYDVGVWTLGYVNGKKNVQCYLRLRDDLTSTIESALSFLVSYKKNWTPADWKELIVDPVVNHHAQWRQFLRQIGSGEDEAADNKPTPPMTEGKTQTAASSDSKLVEPGQGTIRLLSIYTNGIADKRIIKAENVLQDSSLSTNEKLTKINGLMPIPPTTSAQSLGYMLSVSKQAVMKTGWWIQNRKGEKSNLIGRRHEKHHERSKQHDGNQVNGDD